MQYVKEVALALLVAAAAVAACGEPAGTLAPPVEPGATPTAPIPSQLPTLHNTGGPPQPTIMVPPPIY